MRQNEEGNCSLFYFVSFLYGHIMSLFTNYQNQESELYHGTKRIEVYVRE